MFKPYYDIRGKIGAKDLLPLTSASTLANKVLDMGLIDMMMFSINPMYDYGQGNFSIGSNAERYELYSRCEKKGVGISVMKPFNAGQLFPPYDHQEPFQSCLRRPCLRLEKRDNTNFIVTSVISDWAIKFKTGCKSEYSLVDIQGK